MRADESSADFVHVIGKDIAKFHCVYWPAFLAGAGMPMPNKVLVHGHWLRDGRKMSKSLGNVIDPFEILKTFGQDSVRSYFLTDGPLSSDANFSMEDLIQHHNSVICDSYVNMLFRITGKKILKKKDGIPSPLSSEDRMAHLD